MNPELFRIFNFPIKYYSLMYILALVIGVRIGKYEGKKYGIKPKMIDDLSSWIIFPGIIGARIYYIIADWRNFNLVDVLSIWKGISGLAIHGGIIGAIVGIILFSLKNKISTWLLFDMAAPPALLGQAIGRIGNLMNGEAHGVPMITPISVILKGNFNSWWEYYKNSLQPMKNYFPWNGLVFPEGTAAGDQFPNMAVHPTMIYEMILNFIGFLLLFFYFRNRKYPKGYIGAIYIIMYSVIRTIVTMFRADDLYFAGLRLPIVFNILFILVGIGIMYYRRERKS